MVKKLLMITYSIYLKKNNIEDREEEIRNKEKKRERNDRLYQSVYQRVRKGFQVLITIIK